MSTECLRCEDNFCCIYLCRRVCSKHCQRKSCFCVSCQLYSTEEENPAVYCQKCNLLSECYSYNFVGKIGGRNSYILQSHCIDHCQLEGCPHRDEVSVELNRLIPPPDYSHLVRNDGPSKTIDVHQPGSGPQLVESAEGSIPNGKDCPRMVSRVSKKDRGHPKGLLATNRARGARGSPRRTGGNRDAGTEYRLSVKTVIGTRSTNRPCYRGM